MRFPIAVLLLAICSAPAWAQSVYKCGSTYSQTPCADSAKEVQIRNEGPSRSTPAPARAVRIESPSVSSTPPPQAQLPAIRTRSELEIKADQCLAYYRPKLRDPAGAYYSEPSLDGRTLTLTIHGTNGFGGYVTRKSKCEFNMSDDLDPDWTKIHAQRGGWKNID